MASIRKVVNKAGVPVFRGTVNYPVGDTGLSAVKVFYCGRRMNQCRCGRCDGRCGPTNGCPCNDCLELLQKNKSGCFVWKGEGNGTGGDTGLRPERVWYCERRMNQCRCGSCDGQCGPTNGCPCNDCLELLQRNKSGCFVWKGEGNGTGGDTGLRPEQIWYCGRRMNQCRCGRCDGRCGPTNGCPCNDCLELLPKNKSGCIVWKGEGNGTGGDTGLRPEQVWYCGRRMSQCRCGRCDGRCGPTNGCPCNDCMELLQKNKSGCFVWKGEGNGTGGDTGLRPEQIWYCGRRMNQCRCGRCDGQCGPSNGCPCNECVELLGLKVNENSDLAKPGLASSSNGGFTAKPANELYYCGKLMSSCGCGECGEICGPGDGCPCNACYLLVLENEFSNNVTLATEHGLRLNNPETGSTEPSTTDPQEDTIMCIICLENRKTHTIVPCGHYSFCEVCVNAITVCAVCRSRISMRMKIFEG